MKVKAIMEKLKKVLDKEGNIEVVIDYDSGMGNKLTTTVDNLFIEDYTFQGEEQPSKVVRLTL